MELVRDGPKNKTQARCGYQTSFEGRKRGHIRTNHFKNYKLGKHKPMPNRNPSPKALLRPRWFPSRPTGTSSPNRTGLDVNSVNALLGRKSHSGKCVRTNEINEKWWKVNGWWFQTWISFSISYMDVIPTPLTNSYFSRWAHCTTDQRNSVKFWSFSFEDWWTAAIWVWLMIIVVSLVVINIVPWARLKPWDVQVTG